MQPAPHSLLLGEFNAVQSGDEVDRIALGEAQLRGLGTGGCFARNPFSADADHKAQLMDFQFLTL